MSFQCVVVLVTFHPAVSTLERIIVSLAPQLTDILIIDNASSVAKISAINKLVKDNDIHTLYLPENTGIAQAQNIGIEWAKENNKTHILFLDQDSIPAENMLSELYQALITLSKSKNVAAVGPVHEDVRNQSCGYFVRFSWRGVRRFYCKQGTEYLQSDFLISSGMLIPTAIFAEVGVFDEALFIDNVDLDWCFRAYALQYRVYGVCAARLKHCLGERVFRFWVGRWFSVYIHSPLRVYYSTRNRLLLYFRATSLQAWVVQDVPRVLLRFFFFALFVAPRTLYIKMMFKGVKDALLGRTGSLESSCRADNVKKK